MTIPPGEYLQSLFSQWSSKDQREFSKFFKGRSGKLVRSLKANGLWSHATKDERAFLRSIPPNVDPQQHLNAMWRLESAAVLLWAIGSADEIRPFDTPSEGGLLEKLPFENAEDFIANAALRPIEVVEEKRSLAELWHWRSRTRQLIEMDEVPPPELGFSSYDEIVQQSAKFAHEHGDISEMLQNDFPAKGKAYRDLTDGEWSEVRSITMERHRALNWLCGYAPGNRWDQTPTDT